jgi:5,10-methylenetetrahydromethanopterin reductase
MTIGVLMLGDAPVPTLLKRACLVEAIGYDAVWLADERFYREVYSCLTLFAGHTSKLRLGPCVTDPVSRHPALTAMAIATLDEVSGKRAILGIGAGISGFAELGIKRRKPARAIRETIELVRALLRGDSVDYHGAVIDLHQSTLRAMVRSGSRWRAQLPMAPSSRPAPRSAKRTPSVPRLPPAPLKSGAIQRPSKGSPD